MLYLKKNNGITLVALVITIIVLLILAGITLTFVFGENGIIERARIAREDNIRGKEKEAITLAYNGLITDKEIGEISEITSELFKNRLKSEENNVSVIENTDGNFEVTFLDTRSYVCCG